MNDLIQLVLEHILMVNIAVILAIITAVPLAIVIYKKDFHVNFFINVVSLFQAFPALGLFAILVPFVGIGLKLAIIALYLYAIMPIFINTIHALKSISPKYREIINVLDLSKKDEFLKVELPLILPTIISGIRLTTIYAISMATVATLIGAGGLGDLIYLGLQQLNIKITLLGIIPLLILTVITNYCFNIIELKLLPADQKNKRGLKYR